MDGTRHGVSRDESTASQSVIGMLRTAMADYDSGIRTFQIRAASRLPGLVRQLLSEVDGAGAELRLLGEDGHWYRSEPLGGPVPGVDGSHLPD